MAHPVRLCPGCGRPGYSLGSRTRRLAHEPRGHQPTTLAVYVGRYHCLSSPGFCVGLFRPLSFVLLCVCFLLVAV